MTKKILIDAHHPEETRVAILDNTNNPSKLYALADYEFEVRSKDELKGNIYLAKITKIEGSLQAAFVEYGEKRQGFLPFDEVNIKYFELTAPQRKEIEEKQSAYRERLKKLRIERLQPRNHNSSSLTKNSAVINESDTSKTASVVNVSNNSASVDGTAGVNLEDTDDLDDLEDLDYLEDLEDTVDLEDTQELDDLEELEGTDTPKINKAHLGKKNNTSNVTDNLEDEEDFIDEEKFLKEAEIENSSYGTRYGYKIQDVLKAGQYLLVQVIKEERGNKGAALTSYVSIPGRYCVLMPYTPFQISISKKIRHKQDRKRLKDLIKSLNVDKDTNLIIRTASLEKTDEEITQDYNYVLGMWNLIENHAQNYKKPALLLEEGSIIKKIIRDMYNENVEEIVIQGTKAYNTAKLYANALAPEALTKIVKFDNPKTSLFKYYNIEEDVNSIYSPVVFLKSGGYIVINSTEALVAVDVNSGRSKGKQNVEETAIRTNSEAAIEIMKQIKLRDIGGLIIVDFIDMENLKNVTTIEKKIKDLAKEDKAKISIAPISQFGLLEISRQRVKASLAEKIYHVCPKCYGVGYVKPLELNALNILRSLRSTIERGEVDITSPAASILMPSNEAFYLLNHKRQELNELEDMLGIPISLEYKDDIAYPFYKIQNTVLESTTNQTLLFLEQEIEANLQKYKSSQNDKPPVVKPINNNIINTKNIRDTQSKQKKEQVGWLKKIILKLK